MKMNSLVAAIRRLFHIGTGDIQTQSPAFNFAGLPVASGVAPSNLLYVVQNGQAFQMPMSLAFSIFGIGAPNALALSLATAYQATDPTKAALVTVNITSTASITLAVGTTNTADVLIGATNAVAGGTGSAIGKYRNSQTGALVVGANLNTDSTVQYTFFLPAGWFFAVRQTAGAVTIVNAFDQSIG